MAHHFVACQLYIYEAYIISVNKLFIHSRIFYCPSRFRDCRIFLYHFRGAARNYIGISRWRTNVFSWTKNCAS